MTTGSERRPQKDDPVCEHGTALDVHCCNCHSGFIFDKGHECPSVVESLRAYGEEEAARALHQKDRDQYQFWQGWNAALDRLLPAGFDPPEER